MTTRVIKVRFNSHLRGYANKKCVKYSLSEIAGEGLKLINLKKEDDVNEPEWKGNH
ncbi:MAG: hypothetical protein OD815_000892 [Candidatus Alkanophagales archaeon MCA70_species_2]|nr:hypothetical protein [Candidatus Alkanophaga liquidiphilum]